MPENTDEEPGETQSAQSRWWLTNDILAFGLLFATVAMLVLAGLGLIDLSAAPENWRVVWATAFLISVVWAFGSKAAKATFDRFGGPGNE